MSKVPAEDIREGDIVDISPILQDRSVHPWQYGDLDRDALSAAVMVADCENAVADDSEVQGDKVALYTDQMNFTVPRGYLVERIDS